MLRNPESIAKLADKDRRLPIGTKRKPPSRMERDRILRDVAIGVLSRNQFSQRQIAKVLGVSLGRVNQVLGELNARAQKGADFDPDSEE